jgi:hypothetical protein
LTTDDQKIRTFKASIRRRAFRLGLVLLIISLALRQLDVTFGFLFGLCVGLINFDLMCWHNRKLLCGAQKKSGRRAILSFLVRYLVLAAAGVAVFLKENFHPIAALVGFFVVHFTLITYELAESLRRRFFSVGKSN